MTQNNQSRSQMASLLFLSFILIIPKTSLANDCQQFQSSCAGGRLQEFAAVCEDISREIESAKSAQEKENARCKNEAKKIKQKTTGRQNNTSAENARIMSEGRSLGKECEGKLGGIKERFSKAKGRSEEELKTLADSAETSLTPSEKKSICAGLVAEAKQKADQLKEEAAQKEAQALKESQTYGKAAKGAKDPQKRSEKDRKGFSSTEKPGGGSGGGSQGDSADNSQKEEKGKQEGGGGGGAPPSPPPPKEKEPSDPEEERRRAEEEQARREAALKNAEAEKEEKRLADRFKCVLPNASTTSVDAEPPPNCPPENQPKP